MQCHSQAFIEWYASASKYTSHSESSQGKLWVFHPRDLSSFLIRLTRTFTFHHYFIFFFLFPFHALFTVFIFSSHNHDANECHEVNHPHSQVSPILHKFPTNPNIIESTIIPKFQNFPTIPIIPILKYNYFSTIKLKKIFQQILKNSHINKL